MDGAWLPNLFLDRESGDVQLHIDTSAQDCEVVFPAHSLVLKSASKVFRAMLETDNFEEGRTGIVELKVKGDMEDAIFFLRYLYTKNLEHVDMNVYVSLLHTAHLYEVDDLVRLCNEKIVEQVNPLTVCKTYNSLINVATTNLLKHCNNMMLEFAFLIFKKDLHLSLDEETMSYLLSSDELNILDEEQALGALWRWGCAHLALDKCPRKSVETRIENLLLFIRKPLIKKIQEGSPLFRLWKDWMVDTKVMESNSSSETSVKRRQPEKTIYLSRFSEVINIPKLSEKSKQVIVKYSDICLMMFSVNRAILLSGFSMQVIVVEKPTNGNMFQFYFRQGDALLLETPELVLVKEYTTSRVQSNAEEARKAVEQNMDSFLIASLINRPIREIKYEPHYVYRLTINLQKPIMLKPSEPIHLSLSINPKPRTEVRLPARTFSPNCRLYFERNLNVHLWDPTVIVSNLYYFID